MNQEKLHHEDSFKRFGNSLQLWHVRWKRTLAAKPYRRLMPSERKTMIHGAFFLNRFHEHTAVRSAPFGDRVGLRKLVKQKRNSLDWQSLGAKTMDMNVILSEQGQFQTRSMRRCARPWRKAVKVFVCFSVDNKKADNRFHGSAIPAIKHLRDLRATVRGRHGPITTQIPESAKNQTQHLRLQGARSPLFAGRLELRLCVATEPEFKPRAWNNRECPRGAM